MPTRCGRIKQFFSDLPQLKLDHEMVDLATELIERKEGRFRPEAFEDHYETELRKLIAAQGQGREDPRRSRNPSRRTATSSTSWMPCATA